MDQVWAKGWGKGGKKGKKGKDDKGKAKGKWAKGDASNSSGAKDSSKPSGAEAKASEDGRNHSNNNSWWESNQHGGKSNSNGNSKSKSKEGGQSNVCHKCGQSGAGSEWPSKGKLKMELVNPLRPELHQPRPRPQPIEHRAQCSKFKQCL